jgi:multisubunit Na+/H+ antiporter MnhG subunit
LTVLALGHLRRAFTSQHGASAVGIVLALGVPAIAWLEQSALLLLLIAVVVTVIAPFFWHPKRSAQHPAAS